MQVSQNVVRALHSDPTFKPDKDSVVEQLMGQIRNMEDTISSVLVALEYGPDMGTIYRLNQAASTLKISGRKEKDIMSLRLCSRWMKERVDLHFKNFLILTARSEEDILEMKKFHLEPEKLNMENRGNLTNTGLLQLLAKCSATLKDMNLGSTRISGEGLESAPVLKQLETLNLYKCDQLTNTGLLQLLAKCSATLEYLDLEGTGISGEGLKSVPALKLKKLDVSACLNLTNTGLLQLLAKCTATLEHLDLSYTRISGEGLDSVPVLEKLETLDLTNCRNLTKTGLLQLLAKCTATLKSLNLRYTIDIENLADLIVRHAPGKLRHLDLRNCENMYELCKNVSAADRERIRTALPQCEVL